ncbi:fat storage-inducing transmembrane protein 1-like [Hemiscyllium ocellatum]|uniref:fat storage-inducing transmembrane protein 1-like n=1 Tax=Hemiscyllium ocellatum TaxID=170820 RepID=UPI0029671FB7|nr:fat storage-inducing transmembrane protein 1-like [Hemiscyllium ocellatum]
MKLKGFWHSLCSCAVAEREKCRVILWDALVFVTDQIAAVLGSPIVRGYYHLWLAALVIFGPLLQFYISPRVIFANKRNYFHVRLVECCWSWTVLLAGGYVLLLSSGPSGNPLPALKPLSRLAVGAGVRLLCARAFSWIEEVTGSCFEPASRGLLLLVEEEEAGGEAGAWAWARAAGWGLAGRRAACLLEPGRLWLGYELSGDTFMLCFASLVLAEELSAFQNYLGAGHTACGPLRLLFLLTATFLLLWNGLLLLSVTFFHRYSQKLAAAALAQLAWHLTYRRWYRCSWSPGYPGQGLTCPRPGPYPGPGRCVCGATRRRSYTWDPASDTLLYRE